MKQGCALPSWALGFPAAVRLTCTATSRSAKGWHFSWAGTSSWNFSSVSPANRHSPLIYFEFIRPVPVQAAGGWPDRTRPHHVSQGVAPESKQKRKEIWWIQFLDLLFSCMALFSSRTSTASINRFGIDQSASWKPHAILDWFRRIWFKEFPHKQLFPLNWAGLWKALILGTRLNCKRISGNNIIR